MKFITIAMMLITATAFAGKEGGQEGHGGRVWFCKDANGAVSAELLDYYLARTRWSLEIKTETGASPVEIAGKTLERMKRIDPSRAAILGARVSGFMSRAAFLDESEFKNIPDVDTAVGDREGCELKLIIKQNITPTPNVPTEAKFLINRASWTMLDDVQKAGLVLHEILLEDSTLQGQTMADGAMYTNAYVTSSKIMTANQGEYLDVVKKTGYQAVYQGSVLVAIDADLTLAPSGPMSVQFGHVFAPAPENSFPELNSIALNGRTIRVSPTEEDPHPSVSFNQDGTLFEASHVCGSLMNGNPTACYKDVIMNPDGSVFAATTRNTTHFMVQHETFELTFPVAISLDERGNVRAFTPKDDLFRSIGGVNVHINYNAPVILSSDGTIRSARVDGMTIKVGGKFVSACGPSIFSEEGKPLFTYNCSPHGEIAMDGGLEHKKNLLSMDAEPMVLLNGGISMAPGIYSTNSTESFIRLFVEGDNTGFKFCSVSNPDDCKQIGPKPMYSRKELRKSLHLSLKRSTFPQVFEGPISVVAGVTGGIPGFVGGIMYGFANVMPATVAGKIIFGTLSAMFLGMPAGMITGAATIGVEMGVMGIANLPYFQKRRAVNDIIKRHYFFTDHHIGDVRDELEKSLATVQ